MSQPQGQAPQLQLGTFIGVFTPTVLTILGVIMYLRLGWVVGNAGLVGALIIIAFSSSITLITALSMSQLATSMRVGVGGAYFLISRSFGLEVGGAIGIPLYLSQVLSLTLYAYGLAETVRIVVPIGDLAVQILAALIVIGVTSVAARSTELTLKLQVPVMALIAASILSLVAGVSWTGSRVPMFGTYADSAGFWEVFAVFFPAVTGVLTGLSLSGDLRDPETAIPRGVLSSVAVGAVIYLSLPFVLANGADAKTLISDSLIWTKLAFFGWLVMPGMWGAVLSSAFGSILSAPRTLQALAIDRLAPDRFGEVDEKTGEPAVGLLFSGGIALFAVVALPNLNAVATGVSMFFLTTYGALNAVACLETVIGNPAFRPRIRIHWAVSFVGALGCVVAMASISAAACVTAILLEIGIFYFLSRRALTATWGDARSGLLLTGARYALMQLRRTRSDPRNWRPHILVLTTDLETDIGVVRVAENFGQHRGIVTVSQLVLGEVEDHWRSSDLLRHNNRLLKQHDLVAFSEVSIVQDFDHGVTAVAQANGIAGLHSNSVMFGFRNGGERGIDELGDLMGLVRKLTMLEKCTLLYRPAPFRVEPATPSQRRIIVWWAGRQNNGDLMVLLAHLLTLAGPWRGAQLLLKSIASNEEEAKHRKREFASLLPELRIDLEVEVIVRQADTTVRDIIREHSMRAHFIFFGVNLPQPGEERAYAKRMLELLDGLPPALLVRNAGKFRGRLV